MPVYTVTDELQRNFDALRVGKEPNLAVLSQIVREAYEAEPGISQEVPSFDEMLEFLRKPGEKTQEAVERLVEARCQALYPKKTKTLPLEFEAPIENEGLDVKR